MEDREVSLIIFYNEGNEVLIQDRKEISKWGEDWGFFGGELEGEESPKEALLREVREELDFELRDYERLGVFSGEIGSNTSVRANVYISPIGNKFKEFNQKEGDDMKFFEIGKAMKLNFPGRIDVRILKALKERLENESN